MFITDPDTPQPDDTGDDVFSAMDAGIAAAADAEPEATPADEAPQQPEGDATPEGDTPDGEAAPEGEQPEAAETPEQTAEAEAAALGLKEKSKARFLELASQVKELAPIREALKAAGIEDVAQLPQVIEQARVGTDMVQMVMETGASAEQYGMTLDYLKLVNQGIAGDLKAAEKAWDMIQSEIAPLAKLLGKDGHGVDPLDGHDDLRAEVENGDLTRARAAEIAATRNRENLARTRSEQTTQQATAEAKQQAGVTWLQQYDAAMAQKDPTYAGKRPVLNALVAEIRRTLPPDQWPTAVQRAYAAIPDAAPAAPKPPVGPVRSSAPAAPPMAPTEFTSIEDALDFGINAVR